MSRSSEEFELLPTPAVERSELPRWAKHREGVLSVRPLARYPWAMFFGSLALFICSLIVTTSDIFGVPSKVVGDYYSSMLNSLWPVGLPNRTDNWENENSKSMHALISCMASGSCGENQESIVILGTDHFASSISGHVSGEDIWAASVLDALRQLGYTTIFTAHNSNEQLEATYRQFPDLVKVIILEGSSSERCFGDRNCVKTEDHPLGVPAWKMLSFHFWTGSQNPLGSAWTLSPENFALLGSSNSVENIYLGYSIENTCSQIPSTPFEERPRQAYVLAKKADYFGKDYSWSGIDLDNPPFDVSFVAGIRQASEKNVTVPSGIQDLGLLDKTAFYHHLAESRVLVGVGNPPLSPSPYDALCLGVPFINPIIGWDKEDPDNRTKWSAQHGVLQYEDPPYVYNVKKHDEDGFWDALRQAMDTPIERYIIPEMTMDALKARVRRIVENDWRGQAARLLETRKQTGEGKLFEL